MYIDSPAKIKRRDAAYRYRTPSSATIKIRPFASLCQA